MVQYRTKTRPRGETGEPLDREKPLVCPDLPVTFEENDRFRHFLVTIRVMSECPSILETEDASSHLVEPVKIKMNLHTKVKVAFM